MLFYTTTLNNSVQAYHIPTAQLLPSLSSHPSPPNAMAISSDGSVLISVSPEPPTLHIQDLRRTGIAPVRFQPPVRHSAVTCLSFQDTGRPGKRLHMKFALGFQNGTLVVYRLFLPSLAELRENNSSYRGRPIQASTARIGAIKNLHKATMGGIAALEFIPRTGTRIATVGHDGRCRLVDFAENGTILKTLQVSGSATCLSIFPRPDSSAMLIGIGTDAGKVLVFNEHGVRENKIAMGAPVIHVEWVQDMSAPSVLPSHPSLSIPPQPHPVIESIMHDVNANQDAQGTVKNKISPQKGALARSGAPKAITRDLFSDQNAPISLDGPSPQINGAYGHIAGKPFKRPRISMEIFERPLELDTMSSNVDGPSNPPVFPLVETHGPAKAPSSMPGALQRIRYSKSDTLYSRLRLKPPKSPFTKRDEAKRVRFNSSPAPSTQRRKAMVNFSEPSLPLSYSFSPDNGLDEGLGSPINNRTPSTPWSKLRYRQADKRGTNANPLLQTLDGGNRTTSFKKETCSNEPSKSNDTNSTNNHRISKTSTKQDIKSNLFDRFKTADKSHRDSRFHRTNNLSQNDKSYPENQFDPLDQLHSLDNLNPLDKSHTPDKPKSPHKIQERGNINPSYQFSPFGKSHTPGKLSPFDKFHKPDKSKAYEKGLHPSRKPDVLSNSLASGSSSLQLKESEHVRDTINIEFDIDFDYDDISLSSSLPQEVPKTSWSHKARTLFRTSSAPAPTTSPAANPTTPSTTTTDEVTRLSQDINVLRRDMSALKDEVMGVKDLILSLGANNATSKGKGHTMDLSRHDSMDEEWSDFSMSIDH